MKSSIGILFLFGMILVLSVRSSCKLPPIARILLVTFCAFTMNLLFWNTAITDLRGEVILLGGSIFFVVYAGLYKSVTVDLLCLTDQSRMREVIVSEELFRRRVDTIVRGRIEKLIIDKYLVSRGGSLFLTEKAIRVVKFYSFLQKVLLGK